MLYYPPYSAVKDRAQAMIEELINALIITICRFGRRSFKNTRLRLKNWLFLYKRVKQQVVLSFGHVRSL